MFHVNIIFPPRFACLALAPLVAGSGLLSLHTIVVRVARWRGQLSPPPQSQSPNIQKINGFGIGSPIHRLAF